MLSKNVNLYALIRVQACRPIAFPLLSQQMAAVSCAWPCSLAVEEDLQPLSISTTTSRDVSLISLLSPLCSPLPLRPLRNTSACFLTSHPSDPARHGQHWQREGSHAADGWSRQKGQSVRILPRWDVRVKKKRCSHYSIFMSLFTLSHFRIGGGGFLHAGPHQSLADVFFSFFLLFSIILDTSL